MLARVNRAVQRAVIAAPDIEGARLQAIQFSLYAAASFSCLLGLLLDLIVRGPGAAAVWALPTLYLAFCAVITARRPRWRRVTNTVLHASLLLWVVGTVVGNPGMLGYVLPGMWASVCSASVAEPRGRGLVLNGVWLSFVLSLPLLTDSYDGVGIWRISATLGIAVLALAVTGYLGSLFWRGAMRDLLGQLDRQDRLARELIVINEQLEQRVADRERQLLERTAALQDQQNRLQTSLNERTRLSGELADLSERDELTGLYNRRHFLADLQRGVVRDGPVAVLVLDIDHFKRINDQFGHPVGDQVLATLARSLTRVIRPGHTLARMGGEEFAILVPNCARREAEALALECLRVVRDIGFPGELSRLRVSVSIGVAALTRGQLAHWEALISQADQAMYQAKQSGRDRVVMAMAVGGRL